LFVGVASASVEWAILKTRNLRFRGHHIQLKASAVKSLFLTKSVVDKLVSVKPAGPFQYLSRKTV
jgi:hypothetical protein